MKTREVVIVAAARTPIGKAPRGSLRNERPERLGTIVLEALLARAGGLDPALIDDVVIGCAFPEGKQGMNLARVMVLALGWPDRVPGMTVNRFCASGLESIATGAAKIIAGQADIVVAGGVESMSAIPIGGNMLYPHPALVETRATAYSGMGTTAENLVERYGVSRQRQDRFALESHRRAAAAVARGDFDQEIVPVTVRVQRDANGGGFIHEEIVVDRDEGVRVDTDEESLARLRPVFKKDGSVTAGNSSQSSDGAAGVLLMSRERAHELGLTPLAVFRGFAAQGCAPETMGIGPVVAVPKVLKIADIDLAQVGVFELNEAFAVQSLVCMDELGLDPAKVNPNGGAIALGHPLGCTGSFLTNKLLFEMRRKQTRYGIVTMCVGMGMGAAAVFELEGGDDTGIQEA